MSLILSFGLTTGREKFYVAVNLFINGAMEHLLPNKALCVCILLFYSVWKPYSSFRLILFRYSAKITKFPLICYLMSNREAFKTGKLSTGCNNSFQFGVLYPARNLPMAIMCINGRPISWEIIAMISFLYNQLSFLIIFGLQFWVWFHTSSGLRVSSRFNGLSIQLPFHL